MIQIKNVSFRYPNAKEEILSHINLSVAPGEFIALLGPSGSGKTSLTRLVNGLIPEFHDGDLSGEIRVNGEDILQRYVSEIAATVGSVFQDPRGQFFSTDTTSELAFCLENNRVPTEKIVQRVEQTIKDLELEHLVGKSIFELSGGEKQQIAIGSVYAFSPKVLVFDEPSANLDPLGIKRLAKILKTLKENGYTILIAEHRINYLLPLLDRAVYLKKGAIEKVYLPQELTSMSNEERKKNGLRLLSRTHLEKEGQQPTLGKTLLEVKNLTYYYQKDQPLLKNIDFTLRQGEVIGIKGTNGTGKSTFLKIICGLMKEKGGTLTFEKESRKPKQRLNHAYYVMQDSDYQLFTDSVLHEFSLDDISQGQEAIEETLEHLGLAEYGDCHPLCLSGGQKQRLCLAIAKMKNTPIICLDEPTSGLDYENMIKVHAIINSLIEEKRGILIVSHDEEFLYKTCHRLFSLKKGTLTEESMKGDEKNES